MFNKLKAILFRAKHWSEPPPSSQRPATEDATIARNAYELQLESLKTATRNRRMKKFRDRIESNDRLMREALGKP